MTDWQNDVWSRVYVKILKDASLSYTFEKRHVVEKVPFPHIVKGVHTGEIKRDYNVG